MTDIQTRWERGKASADVDAPAASPNSPEHDEWVIDEALEETFPASDPPNPVRPGSTLAVRYAGRAADGRTRALRTRRGIQWLAAAVGIFVAARLIRRFSSW